MSNMADVQDEDQWLYGDEKDESKEEGEIHERTGEEAERAGQVRTCDEEARGGRPEGGRTSSGGFPSGVRGTRGVFWGAILGLGSGSVGVGGWGSALINRLNNGEGVGKSWVLWGE